MKLLYAFTRAAFKKQAIYRFDFWVSIFSNYVMMYAAYYLWYVLYRQDPSAFDVSLQQMTTYGILGMALPFLMETSSDVQLYIAQQVRMGTLEVDLMNGMCQEG